MHKEFDFVLMTIAPVHIGNGEEVSSKSFIYEDNHYYFLDLGKLYLYLRKNLPAKAQALEEFLRRDRAGQRLINFLKDHRITNRDFGGYKIKCRGHETKFRNNLGKISNIALFVKDAFGRPYIPASSLKGAIRTVIENGQDSGELSNDLFSSIRISDSQPIDVSQLLICQKYDYNKKATSNDLNVYRESLEPGTVVRFTITTTSQEAADIIKNLSDYSATNYQIYRQKHLHGLPNKYIQDYYGRNYLYLGAGSGFWTKVNFQIADPSRYQRRSGRTKMVDSGVYKLTKAPARVDRNKRCLINNNENLYEMGKCVFEIKERK